MSSDNSDPMAALPEPFLEGIEYELWGQNVKADVYSASQMHEHAAKETAALRERVAALEAALKDVRWRMGDIREMLMERGFGEERIYGCDEWSTPTVNLAKAIEVVDTAIAAEARTGEQS